jgi:hypothetical protein
MRHILTAVAMIAATTLATFAAENKKDVTAKQIIGTWKYVEDFGKNRYEITRIYSPARKYYITTKLFNAQGEVTKSSMESGTYRVDDDGNILEVDDSNGSKPPKLIVDWLNQNSVMLRVPDQPPMQWKRSE